MAKKLVRINPNMKSLKKVIGKKKHYAVMVMIKDSNNKVKWLRHSGFYGYSLALKMAKKANKTLWGTNSVGDPFGTQYK
jgi:hypothetical protein